MDWVVISSNNWKPHAVPADLADALEAEMHKRASKGEIVRRLITSYSLDCGGMCYTARPWEEFSFCGLHFSVPSEYVAHFYEQIHALTPRQFGSRSYYKLHSFYSCIVLTLVLRRQLLRALQRRIDKAEARATAFYRDKKPNNVVLAEIAEKVSGVKVPPEALGPDRQARFRQKARA